MLVPTNQGFRASEGVKAIFPREGFSALQHSELLYAVGWSKQYLLCRDASVVVRGKDSLSLLSDPTQLYRAWRTSDTGEKLETGRKVADAL